MPRKKGQINLPKSRFSVKKLRKHGRNFNDPQYIKWRKEVYERDKYTCRWPGCNSKTCINAHHIRKWADFPHLRFVISNGITLCEDHHNKIKNQEEYYVGLFMSILQQDLLLKIKEINDKKHK